MDLISEQIELAGSLAYLHELRSHVKGHGGQFTKNPLTALENRIASHGKPKPALVKSTAKAEAAAHHEQLLPVYRGSDQRTYGQLTRGHIADTRARLAAIRQGAKDASLLPSENARTDAAAVRRSIARQLEKRGKAKPRSELASAAYKSERTSAPFGPLSKTEMDKIRSDADNLSSREALKLQETAAQSGTMVRGDNPTMEDLHDAVGKTKAAVANFKSVAAQSDLPPDVTKALSAALDAMSDALDKDEARAEVLSKQHVHNLRRHRLERIRSRADVKRINEIADAGEQHDEITDNGNAVLATIGTTAIAAATVFAQLHGVSFVSGAAGAFVTAFIPLLSVVPGYIAIHAAHKTKMADRKKKQQEEAAARGVLLANPDAAVRKLALQFIAQAAIGAGHDEITAAALARHAITMAA